MRKLIIIITFLCALQSFAQGEANIWYFGENAGLDFNSGAPIPLTNGQLNTFEGCSTTSDSDGNLLFYSDGTTVWNKNHAIMLNGTGLKGHPSSTQSAMIIPKPGSTTQYYIFTVGARVDSGEFGFNYYTLDMLGDGGLGEIVAGPIDLTEGKFTDWTEKVAAIKGADCNTFWVLSYVLNQFYAYKVTSAGVSSTPKISTTTHFANDRRGYLKISPNGKKIAIAHMGDAKFLLYDFNDSTGDVTNEINLTLETPTNNPYGVEFSSNSEKLYVHASNDFYSNIFSEWNNPSNHFSTLYQFDISSNNTTTIINSRQIIDSRNLFRGALQLGPDQKIYRALSKTYNIGTPFLGVIENPENDGLLCNYKHDEISLGSRNGTQGLPPFIASIFSQIEIKSVDTNGIVTVLNDQTANVCFGDNFDIIPAPLVGATYSWYLNNASIPFSSNKNLSFTNATSAINGLYSLVATQTNACGISSILEGEFSIKVFNTPPTIKPTNIKQCDDDNDGFFNFDLNTLKNNELLNGESSTDFEVNYYSNQADADANENAISNPYTNLAPFSTDTIFTRIHTIQNSTCYETNSFTIQVFELPKPATSISNLGKCDNSSIRTDTDNLIIFNLQEKELDILNGQSATNFTIEYFTDINYLNKISNPTLFENSDAIQPIYVKIFNTSNPNCVAFTNFNLEVFTLPTITTPVSLKQCDNDTDGFSPFNLNEVNNKISTNTANETFTYFNSYVGADTNDINDIITTPTAYTNKTPTTDTVWARVKNLNGCHRVSEINLIVSTTGIPATFQKVYYECDDYLDSTNDDRDGVSSFDFSEVTAEIKTILSASGQQLIIIYYRNETDALAETNPILDPSNYRNTGYPNNQQIYIRVDSQLDNDCLGFGAHITLNVEPLPVANTVTINKECDDDFDGFFPFDTSTIEATVLNGQTNVTVTYFDQDNNSLPSPLPNPFLTNSQTITIRVTNNSTNVTNAACYDETSLEFIVEKKPVANAVPNFIECDDDFDHLFPFDTSTIETTVLNRQTGMLVYYFDQNGNSLPSPLPNPFLTATQTITIRVENELYSNCTAETTFDFIVHPKPQFELDETAIYCTNLPPIKVRTYNPLADNYTYEWKDETGLIISNNLNAVISSAGVYTVIATSNEGCESLPHQIIIEASSIASLTPNDITIVDDSENNSISIATTNLGIGDYEYALAKSDGFIASFQDEPYFGYLAPGIYTIFIQDKNNCGIAQLAISIIGFPRFFTPNNDGFNDTWKVIGVNENFYASSNIYIFDRFGKFITQINPRGAGWDGLFKGKQLPATDYWFSVELVDAIGNIRTRKGHFSLIRR